MPKAAVLLCAGALVLHSQPALAQYDSVGSFVMSIGPSFYRLPELGRGTAVAATGAVEWRLTRLLILQASATLWNETREIEAGPFTASDSHTQIIPELGSYIAPRSIRIEPFLGVGLGLALAPGRIRSGATLYATGGVQWRTWQAWALRVESRLRSVRPFEGRTFDVQVGLARFK